MTTKVTEALIFATAAHAAVGQVRKYTGEPYIYHPIEVSVLVKHLGEDTEAAALLHDVVEDTQITNAMIGALFGWQVAAYVGEVTKVSTQEDGNRAARKQKDLEHYAMASYQGKSIKLADIISNSRNIVDLDKDFAKLYLYEAKALLKVLSGGCPKLYKQAVSTVHTAISKL